MGEDDNRRKTWWCTVIRRGNFCFCYLQKKNYQINVTSHFMVFNKAGKITAMDAPRPSTPELKSLLEKKLK